MSQIYDEFRAQMKQRMTEIGIYQIPLARELTLAGATGMHGTTISRMLAGSQEPKLTNACVIAKVLHIDFAGIVSLVNATGCPNCKNDPPAGFVCGTCGRRGGAR